MKLRLIPRIVGALALMAFVPPCVLAGPGRPDAPSNSEPRRIYDIRSRNFIDNPDYREPASVKRKVQWSRGADQLPRYYNPMTQQFEGAPVYRTPASDKNRVRRTSPR
jgi:hypothetical protein